MTVSLLPSPVRLGVVPAVNFGVYEIIRMASPAEMAASGGVCAGCAEPLVTAHGNRPIPGAMVGKRPCAAAEWTWVAGPLCHKCEREVATDERLVAA